MSIFVNKRLLTDKFKTLITNDNENVIIMSSDHQDDNEFNELTKVDLLRDTANLKIHFSGDKEPDHFEEPLG